MPSSTGPYQSCCPHKPLQTSDLKPSASASVPASLHILRIWPKPDKLLLLLSILMVPETSVRIGKPECIPKGGSGWDVLGLSTNIRQYSEVSNIQEKVLTEMGNVLHK